MIGAGLIVVLAGHQTEQGPAIFQHHLDGGREEHPSLVDIQGLPAPPWACSSWATMWPASYALAGSTFTGISAGRESLGGPTMICRTPAARSIPSAPPAARTAATVAVRTPTKAWISAAVIPRCSENIPTVRSRHEASRAVLRRLSSGSIWLSRKNVSL